MIAAGGGLWQVTWMDVRWEDILPTPRHGKPVEINAYWYNALRVMGELDEKEGKQDEILAEKVKKSFLEKFWNEDRDCLNDVVTEGADGNLSVTANTQIRCNQIWALSLPFVMSNQRQAEKIIETVQIHLYTPWGLRSLSPEDADFIRYTAAVSMSGIWLITRALCGLFRWAHTMWQDLNLRKIKRKQQRRCCQI